MLGHCFRSLAYFRLRLAYQIDPGLYEALHTLTHSALVLEYCLLQKYCFRLHVTLPVDHGWYEIAQFFRRPGIDAGTLFPITFGISGCS